jgi:hypothetical protein
MLSCLLFIKKKKPEENQSRIAIINLENFKSLTSSKSDDVKKIVSKYEKITTISLIKKPKIYNLYHKKRDVCIFISNKFFYLFEEVNKVIKLVEIFPLRNIVAIFHEGSKFLI